MGLQDDVDAMVWGKALNNPDTMPGVESITYYPRGGDAVEIKAQVFRPSPNPAMGVVERETRIFVAKSQIQKIEVRADRVRLAHNIGQEPEDMTVADIIEQDAGGYLLRLE